MNDLYREAPLNGIWEGTGNVICLDVLRSIQREPNCVPTLLDEFRLAQGVDRRYDHCRARKGKPGGWLNGWLSSRAPVCCHVVDVLNNDHRTFSGSET